jgi:hypothetical protein
MALLVVNWFHFAGLKREVDRVTICPAREELSLNISAAILFKD